MSTPPSGLLDRLIFKPDWSYRTWAQFVRWVFPRALLSAIVWGAPAAAQLICFVVIWSFKDKWIKS
ncbi:hypothetical protein OAE23_01460 [Synechococcus sp. AH-551-E11]|nr:hypothetical protein [Synechococcus sp. AH-551-E11]MDB4616750.1 hypothetical protein [Synechococcus sp. AH-551-E11]